MKTEQNHCNKTWYFFREVWNIVTAMIDEFLSWDVYRASCLPEKVDGPFNTTKMFINCQPLYFLSWLQNNIWWMQLWCSIMGSTGNRFLIFIYWNNLTLKLVIFLSIESSWNSSMSPGSRSIAMVKLLDKTVLYSESHWSSSEGKWCPKYLSTNFWRKSDVNNYLIQ